MSSSSSEEVSDPTRQQPASGRENTTVNLTIPNVDPSKAQQLLDTLTENLKKAGATNIEITIEMKKQSDPAKSANFFLRMIERSPSPGVTTAKMVFFGIIAVILFIFVTIYAFEKGDVTAILSFFVVLPFGFFLFFFDDIGRMQ